MRLRTTLAILATAVSCVFAVLTSSAHAQAAGGGMAGAPSSSASGRGSFSGTQPPSTEEAEDASWVALPRSTFYAWSCEYWAQPILGPPMTPIQQRQADDAANRSWRLHRNLTLQQAAAELPLRYVFIINVSSLYVCMPV